MGKERALVGLGICKTADLESPKASSSLTGDRQHCQFSPWFMALKLFSPCGMSYRLFFKTNKYHHLLFFFLISFLFFFWKKTGSGDGFP